jgi:membrane protein required for colicin V production
MSYFDIIIAVPLLWAAYQGFRKGFIIEVASLLALAFGIYGAIGFSGFTAEFMKDHLGIDSKYQAIIAFAITFLGIVIIIYFLAKLLERVLKIAALTIPNKLAGAIFSILKYSLMMSALMFVINSFDSNKVLFNQKIQDESLLYSPVSAIAPTLFPSIKTLAKDNPIENLVKAGNEELEKLK